MCVCCCVTDEVQMPLLGKRIMITAPRQYAAKLAARLITAGARPVWLPSITITPLPEPDCQKVYQSFKMHSVLTI